MKDHQYRRSLVWRWMAARMRGGLSQCSTVRHCGRRELVEPRESRAVGQQLLLAVERTHRQKGEATLRTEYAPLRRSDGQDAGHEGFPVVQRA